MWIIIPVIPAISVPKARSFWLSSGMFALLGLLFSRGLIELILPKSAAMIAQLGAVSVGLTTLFIMYIRTFSRRDLALLVVAGAFVGAAIISALTTSLVHDFHYWPIYLLFNCYLVYVAIGASRLIKCPLPAIPFHRIMLFWGWVLVVVATLEQLHIVHMPGYSIAGLFLIRSASLTGAFLHYPILISLIAYITLQWYQLSGNRTYLLSGVIFCLAPFVVASRSGVFMVVFTLLLLWAVGIFRGERMAVWITLLLAFGALGALVSLNIKGSTVELLADRFLSAGSHSSAGNWGRLKSWNDALAIWMETNLLIGEHTGTITNSTKNIVEGQASIAESGILQQLVNFGMIGLFGFYGVLIYVWTKINSNHRLLRLVFVAALAQTLFYQSIEVVPFITLILFMPWISHHLQLYKEALHATQTATAGFDRRSRPRRMEIEPIRL